MNIVVSDSPKRMLSFFRLGKNFCRGKSCPTSIFTMSSKMKLTFRSLQQLANQSDQLAVPFPSKIRLMKEAKSAQEANAQYEVIKKYPSDHCTPSLYSTQQTISNDMAPTRYLWALGINAKVKIVSFFR